MGALGAVWRPWFWALAAALILGAQRAHAAPGANLVLSPGCEPGGPAAWSLASGTKWTCCSTAESCGSPFAGTALFYAGDNSGPDAPDNNPLVQEIYQDVDVSGLASAIDAGTQGFVFSVHMRSHCGMDAAQAHVEYRDAAGKVLASAASCKYLSTSWGAATDTRFAPAGTRTVRVRGRTWAKSGTGADGYFDEFSLRACGPTLGSADCGPSAVLAPLQCPETVTAVVTSGAMDEVGRECARALTVATAFGVQFPSALRTGVCTQRCKASWEPFSARVRAAQAPQCQLYDAVKTLIAGEMRAIDGKCARPVPDAPPLQTSNGARGEHPAASLIVVACAAALLREVAVQFE